MFWELISEGQVLKGCQMWGSNPLPFREKLGVTNSLLILGCCTRGEVYAEMWKQSWLAYFVDRSRLKSLFRITEWESAYYGPLPIFVWLWAKNGWDAIPQRPSSQSLKCWLSGLLQKSLPTPDIKRCVLKHCWVKCLDLDLDLDRFRL